MAKVIRNFIDGKIKPITLNATEKSTCDANPKIHHLKALVHISLYVLTLIKKDLLIVANIVMLCTYTLLKNYTSKRN